MPSRGIWEVLGLPGDAGTPLLEEAIKGRGIEEELEIKFFPVVHRRGIIIFPSLAELYPIPYHGARLSGAGGH